MSFNQLLNTSFRASKSLRNYQQLSFFQDVLGHWNRPVEATVCVSVCLVEVCQRSQLCILGCAILSVWTHASLPHCNATLWWPLYCRAVAIMMTIAVKFMQELLWEARRPKWTLTFDSPTAQNWPRTKVMNWRQRASDSATLTISWLQLPLSS